VAKQPSSIDRLPEEVRTLIGRLRVQGRTIDEIMAHLGTMDVEISRSALGRHVKGLAALKERMEHSRNMAAALVDRFGDQTDNRLQRLNLELMHSVVMQTITATQEGDDGETSPVTFSPEDAMFLARSLQSLASAAKTDGDRVILATREAKKEAAQAVDRVAKRDGGLTRETVDTIKREILGIGA
jgi:arginine repressor